MGKACRAKVELVDSRLTYQLVMVEQRSVSLLDC